ncbi:hypothetical protein [Kaistella daneshvariae]|uniref:hypothetical protein n=1 Tax=Kaistella daneshvariae TaxID=2487074 RepID=UPI00161CCEF8|nr:hypothetical protein [Kaistella daneshvariae]
MMDTLGRILAVIIMYVFFDAWLFSGAEFLDWPLGGIVIYVLLILWILEDRKSNE